MRTKFILFFSILLILTSCKFPPGGQHTISISGVVFGTYYSIIYYDADERLFAKEIDSIFNEFNRSLSFYDRQSLLSRINRNEAEYVDDYFNTVFSKAQAISEETGGAFDATVFPLVNAWGFGFSGRAHMTSEKVDSLLLFVGYEKIRLDNGRIVKDDERVQLDFNAIAKGYAADVVGYFLESKGIDAYMVEIGGDLIARGLKPDGSKWRIGLEIPADDFSAEQHWHYFVEIQDIGLATSGDYRRYYEVEGQRYSHTINPKTGYPVDHQLMSVSVFANDAMSADAYATAFMVLGLKKAIAFVESRDDLEAYFIFLDDSGEPRYYATDGLHLKTRDDI